jgi:hypothetical protein
VRDDGVRRPIARAATAVAALLAVAAGATACGSTGGQPGTPATGPGADGSGRAGTAPKSTAVPRHWSLPADPSAAAARAGLQMLGEEKLTVHYHAHLDVVVRGATIPVPADIGIDVPRQRISALHTHDGTGIVHIESAEDVPFTLGQLFTEWGQPLTARRVGPVSVQPGEQVRVYRDGGQVSGDPAAVRFRPHDEIVVWLGPADEHPRVPSSYDFPPKY